MWLLRLLMLLRLLKWLPVPGLVRVTGRPALAEDEERMVRAGADVDRTSSLLAEAQ